jgi:hypothetical protein
MRLYDPPKMIFGHIIILCLDATTNLSSVYVTTRSTQIFSVVALNLRARTRTHPPICPCELLCKEFATLHEGYCSGLHNLLN